MFAYTLAIAASMVVALTVTPALMLLFMRTRAPRTQESPLVRWLQRGYAAGLSPHHRPPAGGSTRASAAITVRRHRSRSRTSGSRCSPRSRARPADPLGRHPRHLRRRDGPHHHPDQQGTARDPGRAQTRCPHRPGAPRRGGRRRQPRRDLGESRAGRETTTAPWTRIHAVANGYPGLYRDVQTYLDERIEEVLHGRQGAGHRPAVRRGPRTLRARLGSDPPIVKSVPGVVDAHRDISVDVPQINVKSTSRRRAKVRPQTRRRPPGRGHAGRRRGGR